jgi:hypothetical protein
MECCAGRAGVGRASAASLAAELARARRASARRRTSTLAVLWLRPRTTTLSSRVAADRTGRACSGSAITATAGSPCMAAGHAVRSRGMPCAKHEVGAGDSKCARAACTEDGSAVMLHRVRGGVGNCQVDPCYRLSALEAHGNKMFLYGFPGSEMLSPRGSVSCFVHGKFPTNRYVCGNIRH